jgi:hypothetical protein
VASGARSADGKPLNADVAQIWANSKYSNNANQRNNEAAYAMTGKVNGDSKSGDPVKQMNAGIKADEAAVRNNKARNPDTAWSSALGNGPRTGVKKDASYTKPTAQQAGQWERSYYLNTGNGPSNSNLTTAQLRDKYGAPHIGSNYPPGAPTLG